MELIGTEALDVGIGTSGSDTASAAGYLSDVSVGLIQNNIPLDRETTYATADANKADFSGYAVKPVVWNTPTRADDGAIEVVSDQIEWQPSATTTTNNIWGLYVFNDTITLCFVATFDDPPIPMASALDNLKINLRWRPATGGIVAVLS